jgi:hypothetical protein
MNCEEYWFEFYMYDDATYKEFPQVRQVEVVQSFDIPFWLSESTLEAIHNDMLNVSAFFARPRWLIHVANMMSVHEKEPGYVLFGTWDTIGIPDYEQLVADIRKVIK